MESIGGKDDSNFGEYGRGGLRRDYLERGRCNTINQKKQKKRKNLTKAERKETDHKHSWVSFSVI